MAYETEVKYYIPDLDVMLDMLDDPEIKRTRRRVFERNTRFDDEARTLSERGIVLRLREDDRIRLTFKEAFPGSPTAYALTRIEFETEVSNFHDMYAILRRLGYHPFWEYEKFRTTYEFNETEIVLDELPFGNFIEIEGNTPQEIAFAAIKLGLMGEKAFKDSYADLFARVKTAMQLNFDDLTFKNFQGIEVPGKIFTSDE